jgi:hypothetical protein
VVEEFLDGEEASFFALIDGESAVALASAQDHKAVGDGDTGPNTGGMGAYSPAPVVTPEIEKQVGPAGRGAWGVWSVGCGSGLGDEGARGMCVWLACSFLAAGAGALVALAA